jgi:hypothetical protein
VKFKTKSGKEITDTILDELGEACERGDYPGKPGTVIITPVGRPPLSENEEPVTIAFKVPRSKRDQLDELAKSEHSSRSELMRKILDGIITS